jgi:acyl-CoA synthetase (AMP-forming)/AMP-acid ligase II
VGRNGGFFKIRGYRVDPGEITTALQRHPQVADSTVFLIDGDTTAPVLIAVATAVAGAEVTEIELRRHVGGLLPAYMCPGRIVVLDDFPLLPSGKLDLREIEKRVTSLVSGARREGNR